MDDQLKILITIYEKEKARLEKAIGECINDWEYLIAHYHSKALGKVNRELQTLKGLDDNLYEKKHLKKTTIESLEKMLNKEDIIFTNDILLKIIEENKRELEKLNQLPSKRTNESLLLENALIDLFNRKIKNLRLVLLKEKELFLMFHYSNKTLKVILPGIKKHISKWILSQDQLNSIEKLCFKLSKNENKLILIINGLQEKILQELKIILSRIVFQVFFYREFSNDSFLEYKEIIK